MAEKRGGKKEKKTDKSEKTKNKQTNKQAFDLFLCLVDDIIYNSLLRKNSNPSPFPTKKITI